ncbi:peroxisomal acyl-coenzyme A oxidase 1-like [Argopecten irradians]|uniref:peroxisomal acyl-coenzyme A oxidase 1-like n=1 Tax=Argopecten irradians TaxID=31199 RepID=UPI003722AB08
MYSPPNMAARGRVTVNPDLAKEREKATFDVEKLTNFIDGGVQATKRKRYLQDLAINDPELQNSKPWACMTREEQYETAMRKNIYMVKRMEELNITDERDRMNYTSTGANNEASPIGVHVGMFLPTLRKQGTEDQKRRYLPLAEKLSIIGTYAQTELGHGTFIRGLETTATYDPKTREFVLNSPTLTSIKYWPGHLGKTVNFCILMAQLYTNGKCYGMHTFIVSLRDLDTHQSLPGIELGDIGPKFGFNSNDNGYLRLNNVRIPRENMLMRYAKVLEDGSYVKPPNAQVSYGTMTLVRVGIVNSVSRCLAQTCVIATRYSAVRRQTEISLGYLMKCFTKIQRGEKLPGFVSYLGTDLSVKSNLKSDVSLDSLVQAYEHRAARMIRAAAMNVQQRIQEGMEQQKAWNKTTQQFVWVSMAHCHAYVVKAFATKIAESNLDNRTKSVMVAVCKLYAVNGLVENLGDFIQDGFMSTSQVDTVTRKLTYLMEEIRPNAVALVDAFDYPDKALDSCLGRYDGDVYNALYEYSKASPLNEKDVLDSYTKYLKPLQRNADTTSVPAKL